MDNSTWQFINSFSGWFSAFGTIAAVVMSLRLALKADRPKATVHVSMKTMLDPARSRYRPKYVVFEVTNTGDRPITIIGIGWKFGFWKKQSMVQMYDQTLSTVQPGKLEHGDQGRWFIPTDPLGERDEPWLEYFVKALMPRYKVACATLRGQVYPSVGPILEAKPDAGLLREMKEACEEIAKRR